MNKTRQHQLLRDFLESKGFDINNLTEGGEPMLYYAMHDRLSSDRIVPLLQFLFDSGIDIANVKNGYGSNLLSYAVRWPQRMDAIKWLIAHGSDINNQNTLGNTPLDVSLDEYKSYLKSLGAARSGHRP